MPRHEPEIVARASQPRPDIDDLKRVQLAKRIVDVLQGVRADQAMMVLGFIAGRIIVVADPKVKQLLAELHTAGMKTAKE